MSDQIPIGSKKDPDKVASPSISLPKGGGAIRGIGEKFATNPVTGTSSITIPIFTSPGRTGFGPQIELTYDSGSGNGSFGFGWTLSLPHITRKTSKGLPTYQDNIESDTFLISSAEDLVPVIQSETRVIKSKQWQGKSYSVYPYQPRIEGPFAHIERWCLDETSETHWRVTTRDNLTSIYGDSDESRVANPLEKTDVFTWFLTRTYDDKGNLVVYEYQNENNQQIPSALHELHRDTSVQRYLKSISYCFQTAYYPTVAKLPTDWHMQLVVDYGEYDQNTPWTSALAQWQCRPDPFSTYRSGFEIRTYRRCQRFLMFHKFDELGPVPLLVRSTDFYVCRARANSTS
jgi:hypothetical protein